MKKNLIWILAILLCVCGCSTTGGKAQWQGGSGWKVDGDIDVDAYSIDGNSSTGLYFDPDNDGTNEVVIGTSGQIGIGTASAVTEDLEIYDSTGPVGLVGRGTSDTDITYLKLYNEDGEIVYIYGNANQNGITVSGTAP